MTIVSQSPTTKILVIRIESPFRNGVRDQRPMLTLALVTISEARLDIHATVGVIFVAKASLTHLCGVQPVCVFDTQRLCQVSQDCARKIVQSLVNAVGQVVENSIKTRYPIDDASQSSKRVVARAVGSARLIRRCDLYEILADL